MNLVLRNVLPVNFKPVGAPLAQRGNSSKLTNANSPALRVSISAKTYASLAVPCANPASEEHPTTASPAQSRCCFKPIILAPRIAYRGSTLKTGGASPAQRAVRLVMWLVGA